MPDTFHYALQQMAPIDWVVLSVFVFLFVAQVVFLLFFAGRVARSVVPDAKEELALSVMMPLRNEEENLRKNLPGLLPVDGVDYEIVAVDDFSCDSSLAVLGAINRQQSGLRYSSLSQETRYSEKMARNIAIKSARNDWVMLISPSVCRTGSHWPGGIMSRMNSGTGIVVCYSNFEPERTFFNQLVRLEFFFQQLNSFGFIINGLPYIVAEENIAFQKQHYFEEGGFRGKMAESYNHFELVINAFMQHTPSRVFLSGSTSVFKAEPAGMKFFLNLLKKEARLIRHLPFLQRFLLTFLEWIRILFIPAAVFLLVSIPVLSMVTVALVVLLGIGYSLIIKMILNRLDEGKLFLPSLLFALIMPYFKLIFRIVFNYRLRRK
jgi:glycosyltransferase involved in cell wall biosynthesis